MAISTRWYVAPLYSNSTFHQLNLKQKLNQAGEQAELDALRRAVRSIPGSGQLWARYIRYLVGFLRPLCLRYCFSV